MAASAPMASLSTIGANATAFEFPWAGAALLALLVLIAFAAKAHGRHAAGPPTLERWFKMRRGAVIPAPAAAAIVVESDARLDAQTQLHVVRWGSRRVLLASRVGLAPVVLDRSDEAPIIADDPT